MQLLLLTTTAGQTPQDKAGQRADAPVSISELAGFMGFVAEMTIAEGDVGDVLRDSVAADTSGSQIPIKDGFSLDSEPFIEATLPAAPTAEGSASEGVASLEGTQSDISAEPIAFAAPRTPEVALPQDETSLMEEEPAVPSVAADLPASLLPVVDAPVREPEVAPEIPPSALSGDAKNRLGDGVSPDLGAPLRVEAGSFPADDGALPAIPSETIATPNAVRNDIAQQVSTAEPEGPERQSEVPIAPSSAVPSARTTTPPQPGQPQEVGQSVPGEVRVIERAAAEPAQSQVPPPIGGTGSGTAVGQQTGAAIPAAQPDVRTVERALRPESGLERREVSKREREVRQAAAPAQPAMTSQATTSQGNVQIPPMTAAAPAFVQPPVMRTEAAGEHADHLSNGSLQPIDDAPKQIAAERARADLPAARSVIQQITHSVSRPHAEGVIEVRLQPEELGRVRLTMVAAEAGLNVQVTAERPETLDLIRRHIDMLESDLRDQGFDGMSFSFGAEGSDTPENRHRDAVPDDRIETRAENESSIVAVVGAPTTSAQRKLDIRI